jgi:hypothetical protein
MTWIRSHIKSGARLALLALVVQFAVSFGHFHAIAAPATPAAAQVAASPSPGGHEPDHQTNDKCEICAVIALAQTMLFATPPLLLLPQAIELSRLPTDAGFADLNSVRVAFQPRAPPVS